MPRPPVFFLTRHISAADSAIGHALPTLDSCQPGGAALAACSAGRIREPALIFVRFCVWGAGGHARYRRSRHRRRGPAAWQPAAVLAAGKGLSRVSVFLKFCLPHTRVSQPPRSAGRRVVHRRPCAGHLPKLPPARRLQVRASCRRWRIRRNPPTKEACSMSFASQLTDATLGFVGTLRQLRILRLRKGTQFTYGGDNPPAMTVTDRSQPAPNTTETRQSSISLSRLSRGWSGWT